LKFDKNALRLYVVTDRSWLGDKTLAEEVEKILDSGATFLQLREKDMDHDTMLSEAKQIGKIAKEKGIPFVINDSVDICLQSDADGVHVGQKDQNAKEVRAMIGPDKILGVSAQTVEQALKAQAAGADYLGVGAVFGTTTKPDANEVSLQTLKEICEAVSIPVVAIGGIHAGNVMELKSSGANGIAVISAIFAQKDVEDATKKLRNLSDQMVMSDD
jgi:thiamine-phosphate pyrophosphorylase